MAFQRWVGSRGVAKYFMHVWSFNVKIIIFERGKFGNFIIFFNSIFLPFVMLHVLYINYKEDPILSAYLFITAYKLMVGRT